MSILQATKPSSAYGNAETALQRRLARHLRHCLTPRVEEDMDRQHTSPVAVELRDFLRRELQVSADHINFPSSYLFNDPDGFIEWFEELHTHGPGQGDPLFAWLESTADEESMRWFLRQELAGEAGFDDLVALALIRMPARPKMEMARNLWDEFGRGNPAGVHGTLLARMADELGLSCSIDEATAEALALGNLMAGLAVERLAYQVVGALGVIELTAPGRVACVAAGMRRLGMPPSTRRYYELHATLDIEHARRWNAEVLHPLVAADLRIAPLLAQGALMRLEAGQRCFSRYRTILCVP